MYDIIGDIHGQAERLNSLLALMGYTKVQGCWRHPSRKAVFVGDYIDRNSDQLPVLNTIREMVEAGSAIAVMGNHELNAIGWYTKHPNRKNGYLRAHSDKNRKQHSAFLDSVGEWSALHKEWVDWFKALPLFLDLDVLRVAHACWDKKAIAVLAPYLDKQNRLINDNWSLFFNKKLAAFDAVETVLKGKEVWLPDGLFFFDKDDHKRHKLRVKWWLSGEFTWQELAVTEGDVVQSANELSGYHSEGYHDDVPAFVGHYWLTGKPAPLIPSVACVDYSGAMENGKLVAYRWDGEKQLTAKHFVSVK